MALSKILLFTYLVGMVLWGTANTILLSLQFSEKSIGVKYNHPWFQTLTMFLGETYCLAAYYALKYFVWKSPTEPEEKTEVDKKALLPGNEGNTKHEDLDIEEDENVALQKGPTEEVLVDGTPKLVAKDASIFIIFIPSMCDFVGSTLLAFALLNMETSIYQMTRG